MSGLKDVRLDQRADWMLDRIVECGSLTITKVGGDRAGEIAAHRFLDSERVAPEDLLAKARERTVQAAAGLRIVAIQDTTEINFSGRDAKRRGLGPAGDGKAKGFFIHPLVAVDADSDALLGVVDAKIWTRDADTSARPHRHQRALEDKESYRWLEAAVSARDHLGQAAQSCVVVGDRESDIYPLFARLPEGIDIVVRAARNRIVKAQKVLAQIEAQDQDASRTATKLFEAAAQLPVRMQCDVPVPARPGQRARTARVTIKAGQVCLQRPSNSHLDDAPKSLTLNFVEAQESTAPAGTTPLCWRLYTTLDVTTPEAACEVVRLYRLRWRIEEVFRVLKSDGLDLAASQVTAADRLFKLAALGVISAARIIQLRDARDGSSRPASDCIDVADYAAVAALSAALEGGTERQRNPHTAGGLAWLAWVVARLGGWNCYYKPPGPKTMACGWARLNDRLEGYRLASAPKDV